MMSSVDGNRNSEIVMNKLRGNADVEKLEEGDNYTSNKPSLPTRWNKIENDKFRWFLICTGSYKIGDNSILSRIQPTNWMYIFIRLMLCVGAVYMLFQLSFDIIDAAEYPIILTVVFFFSILSVIPAQHFNLLRMGREPANNEDNAVRDECIHICLCFAAMSFFPLIVALGLGSGSPLLIILIVLAMLVLMYLTSSLYFLLVDLRVSLLLLDQLHALADARKLTSGTFQMVRAEVNRRASASKMASDFILIPCILSVVGISFTVLNLDEGNLDVPNSVGVILGLSKELFYTAFAFFYVAKVNARADELTVKLGRDFWGSYPSYSPSSTTIDNASNTPTTHSSYYTNNIINTCHSEFRSIDLATAPVFAIEPVQVADLHRLSMHASSLSDPISFTLLFKRVNWQNVAVSGLSLSVTIGVGIIKSIIGF